MKAAVTLIAIPGLLVLLAGCPTTDNGDGPDTTPGGTTGVAETAPAGSYETIQCRFEVDGLRLGLGVDQTLGRYPADGELTTHPYWADEGVTGVVAADRRDGSTAELENVYFLGGQLVGFARHVEQSEAAFAVDTDTFSAIAGEPEASPPAWALETKFFEGFEEAAQEDFITYQYWGDEAARVILVAMYNDQIGGADYMLLHAEHFDECLRATADPGDSEQPAAGQAPPPPPPPPIPPTEQPDPPSEPGLSGHYRLDGVKLGSSYRELADRYPGDGELSTTEAWTEDRQTGMITATATNGTPLTESAVFLNGRLVGFSRVEPANAEQFNGDVDALVATFGKSLSEPPQWVRDSAFFADGYQPAPPYITPRFWVDEDSRTVLMALLDSNKGTATTMLADADRYQPAMRLAMRAAMKDMMNQMQEQEEQPLTVPPF